MGVAALAGRRLLLRAVREEDVAVIEAWYAEIPHPLPLSREAGEGRSVGTRSGDLLVIKRIGEPEPIGIVEYAAAGGWLTIGFIALEKGYRGWGYGSEAVRLLEGWAIREGMAERFRAEVSVGNGLGLYFWLRLGYRPTEESMSPDTLAMVRTS